VEFTTEGYEKVLLDNPISQVDECFLSEPYLDHVMNVKWMGDKLLGIRSLT